MTTKEDYFKEKCTKYLMQRSIHDLRGYGRFLNLQKPTCLKKENLIEEIIAVLCNEEKPTRKKVGAPVKNSFTPNEIIEQVEDIKKEVFGEETQIEEKCEKIEPSLRITFSVDMEKLNEKQKRLMISFLNSLAMKK